LNDRRSYNLIKFVIGQEHEFKTVHNGFKELIKRIQASKEAYIMETLLPLLYRSGCIMFNRSHLSTIMEYSKSDKDGMGAVAHEMLNEISQRNPDLFKTHIGRLCKDLVDQAPTATSVNDPIVVETLKACSTYARKYPKDVPMDKSFIQTMISYALYGQPSRAAKYAVNIMLAKKDDKSLVSATDLLQRIMKDWTYGSTHFLNKLAAIGQLEYLTPQVTEDADEKILNMTVQQILLEVRAQASEQDPEWVDDADMDEEIQAKCLALKILVNRLRSVEDINEAKDKAKPVWKMLTKLVKEEGEICKTKDTPKHHKARLRLQAALLMLKLCTQKHFDDLLTPEGFNMLSVMSQDGTQEVRHRFVRKLQKYLADNRLRSRYFTIPFLLAFEPNAGFKERVETWIRSRARYFSQTKQPVFEAIMPRLISLLAHHPDYGQELDLLIDHARYILFYISLVATENNLGLIYKYAERVKQTQDSLDPESVRHRVLSDLAQSAIRKWQEKKGWAFTAYPQKVGLPVGLYSALKSHSEAQEAAEKQYVPDGVDGKLDELLRAMDRKKKRKSVDDRGENQPSKKVKLPSRPAKEAKEPKSATTKKTATPKAKKPASSKAKLKKPKAPDSSPIPEGDRRRSGRSRVSTTYVERDSSDDEEEMLEGVAEWRYEGSDKEDDDAEPVDDEQSSKAASDAEPEAEEEEEEEPAPAKQQRGGTKKAEKPAAKTTKKQAAVAASNGDGDGDEESELSDAASVAKEEEEEGGKEEEEAAEKNGNGNANDDYEMETTPPPARASRAANGRKAKAAAPAAKTKAAKGKAKAPARPTRASARRKAGADEDEMDVDEE